MRIRKAVSQLSRENYLLLAREIKTEALVRFPVLEYLFCMSTEWESPDYIIDQAIEVHIAHWAYESDTAAAYSLETIRNELADCFEALLRRETISESLKKFKSGRAHADIELRHAKFLNSTSEILDMVLEGKAKLSEEDFLEIMLNLLTVLQYTRYEKEEDRQLWDFLFAISSNPRLAMINESWSISSIVEIMNNDQVAPQKMPWDEKAVTNLRDRFRRFCAASMPVAIK